LNQSLDDNLVVGLSEGGEPDAKEMAGAALYSYNVKQTGLADRRPIAAVAKNPATGETVGGLWGRTELGLLFLDMFFLPEAARGRSVGSQLLELVEAEARRRGCQHSVVETSTFQAPGFYVRHGYEEFGRVPFTVPGAARMFLRKRLA
jgi:GNAT superfamily N-acetyltransferase